MANQKSTRGTTGWLAVPPRKNPPDRTDIRRTHGDLYLLFWLEETTMMVFHRAGPRRDFLARLLIVSFCLRAALRLVILHEYERI